MEITLNLMRRFGVDVPREGWQSFRVPGSRGYASPGEIHVEGDASSASYFLAAGAIAGGPVKVEGIGADSIQGDVRFVEVLERMGAQVSVGPNWIEARSSGGLRALDADLNHIPDAAMTAAMMALFADGPSTLRNIASWRVKETDRIAAMATELRKVGALVEEGADYLRIAPPERFQAATIDTYDDHRMAMCFSLAALGGVPVRINDPGCVAKTFPEYFRVFATLGAMNLPPVIAIDGPSASGKGTVASLVAEALGFHALESGALYRLVALASLRAGVAESDEAGLEKIASDLDVKFSGGRILLNGEDVTDALRGEAIGNLASSVAQAAARAFGPAGPPARVPPGARPGRGWPRHGHRRVPRRAAESVPDRKRPGACRAPV